MNVFVLTTGRSGSTTLFRSCNHITNFTAGHESRSNKIGDERVTFPRNHIEVDNRLAYFLGRLDRRYGASMYVHLKRDIEATAISFQKRTSQGRSIIHAFKQSIIQNNKARSLDVCVDYVKNMNANIEVFLEGKKHITFHLESPQESVEKLWGFISAEGDIASAIKEFETKWNESRKN